MSGEILNRCQQLRGDLFPEGFYPEWLNVSGNNVTLTLPFPAIPQAQKLVEEEPQLSTYQWRYEVKTEALPRDSSRKAISAKNMIAVASGKGGVGKSAVTLNLALALAETGARVGVLDADVFGPSVPTMLGNTQTKLEFTAQQKMLPIERYNLQVNSLGYLVEPGDATVWRGPMASRGVEQLCFDTQWGNLDYLLVDMPPGTGDIQLTLSQKLPVTGAVIVTTPQEIALADARKAVSMFSKVDVPVVGLVENMSFYQCNGCGDKDYIFGKNGGVELAQQVQAPLLGQWPLNGLLREQFDLGRPLLVEQPEHPLCQYYRESAARLVANAWYLTSPHAAR
ncbi:MULTISPECIES: iron-sulfur cluster carrier protein ApbC [Gammaproteobacteria]|uniref:iron-sulfur cluster carrier protein ApbC n=1 Tax=Gammaproteobacteria TaxID=1236 RepID=UPI000DD0825E|nr:MULTISPECIES: iron-sulfur cluster carrier protein ApbC [Gammaproteobacteria]RTE87157.1 iron-sulfur cluster carrier protein ApbC [Aliidiomarina sp. B3213]TCZ93055.1 iron-sulfur cluster carrier protein ApbC [Lysobacter sp. N42]